MRTKSTEKFIEITLEKDDFNNNKLYLWLEDTLDYIPEWRSRQWEEVYPAIIGKKPIDITREYEFSLDKINKFWKLELDISREIALKEDIEIYITFKDVAEFIFSGHSGSANGLLRFFTDKDGPIVPFISHIFKTLIEKDLASDLNEIEKTILIFFRIASLHFNEDIVRGISSSSILFRSESMKSNQFMPVSEEGLNELLIEKCADFINEEGIFRTQNILHRMIGYSGRGVAIDYMEKLVFYNLKIRGIKP